MNKIDSILHNINKLIVDKNLNKTKFADELGISRGTLHNITTGKTELTVIMLLKFSEKLNVPVSKILNEENTPTSVDRVFDALKKIVEQNMR